MKPLSSMASRILFAGASVGALLAIWEKLANMTGRTLVFLAGYSPARLLDWAATALLFVIVLQLREIKDLTHGPGSSS
jgi:hypothetical protein